MKYALTAVAACVVAFIVMQLWQMHPGIPLYYVRAGDELLTITWVKAIIEDGWYANISHLGAPFGMSFGDFPVPSLLHMIVLRLITLVIHSASVAVNMYFLLGFPLVAVVSLYVLRRLGVSWAPAMVVSVVFAFLPMRFQRNESHLFYAQYYLVPILVLAVVWVLQEHPLVDSGRKRPTRDGVVFLAGLLAVAWDNEYNAVFGMMLLFLAGVASLVRSRRWTGALAAVAGICVIFIAVEFELLPTTIYRLQHGPNPAAIQRPPQSSEIYALTLAQLVLPIEMHRIRGLANRRAYFDAGMPELVNENSSASLGLLGALGFLGSIGALLLIRGRDAARLWPDLARINLAAFLLTTIGGVGAIISYYFVPELRAYNRISPLIGFVSLTAVALGLESLRRSTRLRALSRRGWHAVLLLIGVLAILDQTTSGYVPAYAADRESFLTENAFVNTLEQRLPAGAAIYQLPHVLFPESGLVENLGSWDQTALYLHSRALRYSFGATRGRPFDALEQETEALPPRDFAARLVLGGFDGIAVYRAGYADHGAAEEAALASELGAPPMVSADASIAFFDLTGFRRAYTARLGADAAQRIQTAFLEPKATLSFATGDGFFAMEMTPNQLQHWRWAGSTASVTVNNASGVAAPEQLRVLAATALPAPAHLRIRTPGAPERAATIDAAGQWISVDFVAPPGASTVAFDTDAQRLNAPADPRDLRFRLLDWQVTDRAVVDAAAQAGALFDAAETKPAANVDVAFGPGCYGEESGGGRIWNWCGNTGTVTLRNTARARRTVELRFSVTTGSPADVSVTSNGTTWSVPSTPQGMAVKHTITLPPGTTMLRLQTGARPIVAPGDPRTMAMQISDLHLIEVKAPAARR